MLRINVMTRATVAVAGIAFAFSYSGNIAASHTILHVCALVMAGTPSSVMTKA